MVGLELNNLNKVGCKKEVSLLFVVVCYGGGGWEGGGEKEGFPCSKTCHSISEKIGQIFLKIYLNHNKKYVKCLLSIN